MSNDNAVPTVDEFLQMGVLKGAPEFQVLSRTERLGRHFVTILSLTKEAAAEIGIGAVVHLTLNPDKVAAQQVAVERLHATLVKYARGETIHPLEAVSADPGSGAAAVALMKAMGGAK